MASARQTVHTRAGHARWQILTVEGMEAAAEEAGEEGKAAAGWAAAGWAAATVAGGGEATAAAARSLGWQSPG